MVCLERTPKSSDGVPLQTGPCVKIYTTTGTALHLPSHFIVLCVRCACVVLEWKLPRPDDGSTAQIRYSPLVICQRFVVYNNWVVLIQSLG